MKKSRSDLASFQKKKSIADPPNPYDPEPSICFSDRSRPENDATSFRQMLDLAPVPIVVHKEGRFVYVNQEAAKLHGFHAPGEMNGRFLDDFIHEEDKPRFSEYFATKEGYEGEKRNFEIRIVRADNELLDLEIVSIPVAFGGGAARMAVCTDKTEKNRARTALVDNLMFMETLIDTIPNPIFYKNVDGVYVGCNKMFAGKILGLPRREIFGKTDFDFPGKIPPEYAAVYHEHDRKILSQSGVRVYESNMTCDDGIARDFIFYKAAYINNFGKVAGLVGIMVDITDLRKAERNLYKYQARLRSLTSSVALAEEKDRRRIAENLHERIGQTLAVSKMKLGVLSKSISATDLACELDEVRKLIGQTIQDARSLTFELCPPVLHELGLNAALEWLVDQLSPQTSIQLHFEDDGKTWNLEDEIRMLLFRAAHELLSNAVAHSCARNCYVRTKEDGKHVFITVEDDGVGFDANKLDATMHEPSGFGLFSIRERMRHLGGRLEIDSKPGGGSRVDIVSPRSYCR